MRTDAPIFWVLLRDTACRVMRKHIISTTALFVFLLLTLQGEDRINESPIFSIKNHAVSSYLLDKYFMRFSAQFEQEHGRKTDEREREKWFIQFVNKHRLIAYAEDIGYRKNSVVRNSVARMERHMLTSVNGPYYQRMLDSLSGGNDLKTLQQFRSAVQEVTIVEFPNSIEEQKLLGLDFFQLSPELQNDRMSALGTVEGINVSNSLLIWPCEPFSVFANEICQSRINEWFVCRDLPPKSFYILIRSRRTLPANNVDAGNNETFRQLVNHVNQRALQLRHRAQVLFMCNLTLNETALINVTSEWSKMPDSTTEVPESANVEGAVPLFHFRFQGRERSVGSAEFAHALNDRFVHRIPRSLAAIKQDVEDFVLAEFDLQAARGSGIDRERSFCEDRKGFEEFQILDAFENEQLRPQATVSDAEVETYYQANQNDFRQANTARFRHLIFAGLSEAARWCSEFRMQGALKDKVRPIGDCMQEVNRGQPLEGFKFLEEPLLRSPEGTILGPFSLQNETHVFIKQASVGVVLLPLTKVAPSIVAKLRSRKIEDLEDQLSRRLRYEYQFTLTSNPSLLEINIMGLKDL